MTRYRYPIAAAKAERRGHMPDAPPVPQTGSSLHLIIVYWADVKFETTTTWTVEDLTTSWIAGEMRLNPEYQRGARWNSAQKQSLIDSVFRAYPIPPIFLQEITTRGLKGPSSVYEIVDGQQRILSVSEFVRDSFETLEAKDRKLRLPNSLRSAPAPWGGQRFSRLSADLQERFRKTPLTVVLIATDAADEVRDLFVRLQAGTAQPAKKCATHGLVTSVRSLYGLQGSSRNSPNSGCLLGWMRATTTRTHLVRTVSSLPSCCSCT
jgi:hypothetical protein